jgi:hypothetical protein
MLNYKGYSLTNNLGARSIKYITNLARSTFAQISAFNLSEKTVDVTFSRIVRVSSESKKTNPTN